MWACWFLKAATLDGRKGAKPCARTWCTPAREQTSLQKGKGSNARRCMIPVSHAHFALPKLTTPETPDRPKEQPTGTGSRGASDGTHGINSDCCGRARSGWWGVICSTRHVLQRQLRQQRAAIKTRGCRCSLDCRGSTDFQCMFTKLRPRDPNGPNIDRLLLVVLFLY